MALLNTVKLRRAGAIRNIRLLCCLCEEWLLPSNLINNLQHMVHDHITSVLWRKYSFDYFHCLTMSFPTSSNGSLVFINSHKNSVLKHGHIVAARKLIRIYSPIHMMAPGDNLGPTRYVFRVSFENVMGPITMAIPECAHSVVWT